MPSSTIEVQEGAVHLDLSSDQLNRLGWKNGQRIEVSQLGDCITLRPKASGDKAIIRSAMSHLATEVGFNIAIDSPILSERGYRVAVYRKHDRRYLGNLSFTEFGELIPEASTSDAEIRAVADAP